MAKPSMTETIAAIASKELWVDTLETRRSDSLDFHEVPVWRLKAALEAAYMAGRAAGKDK